MCTWIKDGRQEEPRNNKRLEVQLEKLQVKNLEGKNKGKLLHAKKNFKSIDEIVGFEALELFLKQKIAFE